MRLVAVTALALLLFLPGLPAATAQEGTVVLLEDAAGDHGTTVDGNEVPVTLYDELDLLSLEWGEDPEGFTLSLQTGDLSEGGTRAFVLDYVTWMVHLEHGGIQYAVEVDDLPLLDSYYRARLLVLDPSSDRYATVSDLDLTVDADKDTLTTTVPRDLVLDADGKAPGLGDTLGGIHATSSARLLNIAAARDELPPVTTGDRMPDDGAAAWTIQHGIQQSGHVRLDSDRPMRASNGEATTFLYELDVTNLADVPDRVRMEAVGAPEEWSVTFPTEDLRLDAGETRTVPVLVTVPFVHQHGTLRSFLVEAHSQSDPDGVGRIELGVRYPAVPQPAGHHDTLHLHSSPNGIYLNTLEDDPADLGTPASSGGESGNFVTTTYRWMVPLLPSLEMGLDFDPERLGAAEFLLEMPAGGINVEVRGTLYHGDGSTLRSHDEGDNQAVATFQTALGNVLPGDVVTIAADVEVARGVDRVPSVAGKSLTLHLEVTATAVFGAGLTPAGPTVHTGGSLRLPLEEWHDDVDDHFRDAEGVDLYSTGPQHRLVNPGRTVVFQVTAENLDDEPRDVRLSLAGLHTEWARILGDLDLHLAAGQVRTLAVAVTPPEGAADGELADLTLHVAQRDDPTVQSFVRVLAEVDTETEHAGEEATAVELEADLRDRDAPGPGAILLGLTLGAAALAARRRP